MKKIYVQEEWCLKCRLCEYICAYANSGFEDIAAALKDKPIRPRITVEESGKISYAVSCRHCDEPSCVKGCIAGAISKVDGIVKIDKNKCVGCFTCVLSCPYGAVAAGPDGAAMKCELCVENSGGSPMCVKYCPNRAIILE
ncbi:MAG: 4Fe-4S binding protein [Clostridiales bacterium]|jgi:carbon-monoxide dehydrogenase iron sulfur subunit|nr:4Fe-4S binding protein [Clostridiales bacterium]